MNNDRTAPIDPAVGEPYSDEEIAAMRAILAVVDGNNDSAGPRPWALDGEAPGPRAEAPAPELTKAQRYRLAKHGNISTHTGTDPLGRAIGPAEDHTQIKKVRDLDGKIVTPDRETGETPALRKAREKVAADAAKAKAGAES